ncbi:hypothetical protein [Jeotgalibacillus campisalis]|uniref:Uncharacterized protein n=1 Tax=Jeotgalibacillus campisalis TaxID=220754 RepID=A0A0C2W596_9BACL|nr:hypothetical protein [Jeotgalibacillus campisalis]KIL51198.1 hypothetical protein KR50_10790 [Jeotgalibacillus campisalis]
MSAITIRTKIYYYLSLTLFIVGVISWVPYLVLNIQEPYGMLTFILNPIGFYFGYLAKKRLVALSNLAMLFSFVPVVIYVYLTKGYIPM